MVRSRLDRLLVLRGLAPTRERAQAIILAGGVSVDGRRVDKAGTPVDEAAEIAVAGPPHPFVSRGGIKLAAALDAFGFDAAGATCLDVGASTGGFTDCFLQRGAAKVYAVDVGHGQLDAKLRNDPRVVVREKVNARALSRDHVPEPVGLAAIDVSFISTRLILPSVVPLLESGGALVVLVKPQFEAGRAEVGKGGIVRSGAVRLRVLGQVEDYGRQAGLDPVGSLPSPIRGAHGNEEFLLGFRLK